MPKTRKKIPNMASFMMTNEDRENLDTAADNRNVSRSALIRIALRDLFTAQGLTVTETE